MTTPKTEEEWEIFGDECDREYVKYKYNNYSESYNYHKEIYENRQFSKCDLTYEEITQNLYLLESHAHILKIVSFNITGILRKEMTLDEMTHEIVKNLRLLPDKFIGTSGQSGWIRFTSSDKNDTYAPLKKAWIHVHKEVLKSNKYTSETQDGTVYYNGNDNQFYNLVWDTSCIYLEQILCKTFYNDKCGKHYGFSESCCNSKYYEFLNDMKSSIHSLFKNTNYHAYLKEAGPESWNKFIVSNLNNSEASKNISCVVESTFKEYFEKYIYN